jgi:ABC-2 type transport system ATP-binding protein|tara:strand:+ start:943 stop:1920 length:978 start_codon:yes stop_codon:yes gene_type:complete
MSNSKEKNKNNNNPKILVENVSKVFGSRIAVNDVSFSINKGEVIGFLGPNGAGKSTTMRLLTSYYTQNSGNIYIDSINTKDSDIETRKKIGYLPESNPLYGEMLVKDYLRLIGDLRDLSKSDYKNNLSNAIDETGIHEYYYSPINQLSKGYRQRVGLAQAILHQPEILILDEPTEGLDPNQRVTMRNLIKSLGEQRTIMLSTHVLQEVETTCSRIILINKGKLIAEGTIGDILENQNKNQSIEIEIIGENIQSKLNTIEGIKDIEITENNELKKFHISLEDGADPRKEIFNKAVKENWIIINMNKTSPKLEDVFKFLTIGEESSK